MKSFFLLFLAFVPVMLVQLAFEPAYAQENASVTQNDGGWVTIPAGGKPAYMGIHGGTMPVSLLVSEDHTSLFSFVGRTGNDFLETLRNAYLPLPSFGNSTRHKSTALSPGRNVLFAGNATASMPVITLDGDLLSRQEWFDELQPFGLSEVPLSIEGRVSKPQIIPMTKKYRLFFMPDYLQPRRQRQ